MIIKRVDKETRQKRREEAQKQWHRKFAWKPFRLDKERVVWLGFYWQRYAVQRSTCSKYILGWEWEYGLEHEVVRQRLTGEST